MALRKGARSAGAEIYEQTEALAFERTASGEWKVRTGKGEITAEHLVLATGNYARQTGRLLGLNVPAIPVEHQYIVYDESPELKAYRQGGGRELAVLREPDASYYLREERMGWILGPYEKGAPARFADGVPDWFGRNLFPGDLDRLVPHVEAAMRRVPALENCGIKDIVNGPISYTPDGSPLIGPAWGLPNVWLNEGHSFGITAAGGAGWQLAEWIVEGEPGIDMLAVDPRRFGAYTSKRYLVKKNEETYRNVFTIHFPDEERPDARPGEDQPGVRQDRCQGRGLGPALRLGARQLVRPQRRRAHATAGASGAATTSSTSATKRACMRERVGIIDLTPFTKHEVTGPGRGGLARQPGGQQGARQGRAHGAVARAHAPRRHPLGVHHHQDRRAALLRRERGRRGALRQRLPASSRCRRMARWACATSPTPAAASCSRDRSRARCSRSSPTRRSTTHPFPGSRRRLSRRGWRSMCTRCA